MEIWVLGFLSFCQNRTDDLDQQSRALTNWAGFISARMEKKYLSLSKYQGRWRFRIESNSLARFCAAMPRFIIVLRVWKLASKYYLPPKKGRKKERNAGSPNNCVTRRPKLSAIHVTANLTGQPLIVWCWFQGRTNVHPVSLYPRVYNLINRIAYFALAAISRFSIFCSITSFKIIFTGTYSNLANLWYSLLTKSIVLDGQTPRTFLHFCTLQVNRRW